MRKSLASVLLLAACSSSSGSAPDAAIDAAVADAAPVLDRATIHHSFGAYTLAPGEEVQPCLQWTLDNEKPIYVQAATLSNDGFYHHSNWMVVPEDVFAGPDGFFVCDDRGFNQITAAIEGTVLMAQSTQAIQEAQRFPDGVVVKIPPHHKLVAGAHLLNTSDSEVATEMRMSLEILHPRLVEGILTPFHLDNRALAILPHRESRFEITCDLTDSYEATADHPLDLKIRFVLPHFHYKANYWKLEIVGGPRDGEVIHEVNGFTADPNGIAFDPPLDLSGATGLKMTCGFFNDTDNVVGYGIGDQEMCEMLGLAESHALLNSMALDPEDNVESEGPGGIPVFTAPCSTVGIAPNPAQGMPDAGEKSAPLYVPPSDDPDVDTTPECTDTPAEAQPAEAATLSSIAADIFTPRCSFNACHGGQNAQNGLDLSLTGTALYDELTGHTPVVNVDIPLIAPDDPEGSLLYQMISRCGPTDAAGTPLPHMPLNSPQLLPDELVARVRAWIADGAPNN